MGTFDRFLAIFAKADDIHDFLFAFFVLLAPLGKESTLKGKNLIFYFAGHTQYETVVIILQLLIILVIKTFF